MDPIYLFVIAHGLAAWCLLHSRSYVPIYKYGLLSLITTCCLGSLRSPLIRAIPGDIGSVYVLGFVFHSIDGLFFDQCTPPPKCSWVAQCRWALSQLFNPRRGVRQLPAFDKHDPSAIPSARSFLIQRTWDSLWTFAILYMNEKWQFTIYSDDILDAPNGFLRRLFSVSARELSVRIYIVFLSTCVPYCTLRFAHSIASITALLCGDTPAEWPPLFGSVGDAYTIRRYWS